MSDSNAEKKTPRERLRSLIAGGSDIAGSAIGGALGYFASGPGGAAAGAVGGAAVGLALERVGQEISDRFLAPREKVRVGGVLALAASNIDARIKAGESVRQDGFFENSDGKRSDGEEVIESITIKAQKEPEEKKLKYIAKLMENIAFDDTVKPSLAHMLVKNAESLTYRQYSIINLAAFKYSYELRNTDYRNTPRFDRELYEVLFEIHDLYNRGFLSYGGTASLGITDVVPSKMHVQGIGADLFNLMGLSGMPREEIEPIASALAPSIGRK